MHTVYHANTLIDAHLVKDRLEQAGIPAFIAGEYLTGGVGQLPARDFISVAVPDSCADDAGPLVDELVAMLAEARDQAAASDDDADDAGLLPSVP
ncbi:MAG TPA: DUF2007 domain-containing protein [Oleiagrimonas sp.]|nr:DUF2007 domain-containing protein [Oleiagrimonas sp.]